MSTTTPRTDENSLNWDRANRPGCDADFARALETELTAANARIAALNKAIANWKQAESLWGIKKAELTRQLAAANARIAELEKERDEIETQLSDARSGWEAAESNILDGRRQLSESQAQLNCCSNVNEGAKKLIADLEAQLASAREDGERLNRLEELATNEYGDVVKIARFSNGFTHLVLGTEPLAVEQGLRSAIDSTRGITSPPASVEPGPASSEIRSFLEDLIEHIHYIPERKLLALDSDPHPPSIFACLKERAQELLDKLPPPPTQDGKERGK